MADALSRPVVLRRLWPQEQERLLEHLLRLDPEDRSLRFGGSISDARIRTYVEAIDWTRTLILAGEIDGVIRGLGELKLMEEHGALAAEAAFSVERPYQGRRFGTLLFRRLVGLASNRGARRMFVICVAHNQKMRRIATSHAARLLHMDGEIEAVIDLPFPSPITYGQELLDDVAAFVVEPRPAAA